MIKEKIILQLNICNAKIELAKLRLAYSNSVINNQKASDIELAIISAKERILKLEKEYISYGTEKDK
jgi:hypothetical protein